MLHDLNLYQAYLIMNMFKTCRYILKSLDL